MPGFTDYFERIEEKTEEAYSVAREARRQGKDPEKKVDIPVAEDLAAKSEGLISASMHPELEDSGVQDRIRELEEEYGKNDERVALVIGKEIAENKFYEFEEFVDSIDAGLRVGLAYMTGGIVTAPLEGIADVKIKENGDGSEYLAVYYAGPIRSAGGTASAMSVLLADYIRKKVGLDRYKPSEEELNRYAVEVEDYFTRVTKKQYTPERKETKMIAENVPIEITGTPTENLEVSNHKDMDRIDTNRVRGGMALVYLDGLPLKASKIKKRIKNYGEEFDLMNWDWVWDYLELQKEIHSSDSDGEDEKEGEEKGYEPSDKFLGNIVAGRPVFSHQGKKGGFRLRYGRSRNAGLAACSFHPATLEVCQRFPAIGTQLKIEYPGKATVVMSCDSIKGPLVRLEDGSLVAPETKEEVEEIEDDIEEIVFVGDMLVPFGEFLENGKKLLPSPWVEEWWAGEVKEAMEEKDLEIDVDSFVNPPYRRPGFETAVEISEELGVPLHPEYVYLWDSVPEEELRELYNAVISADFGGEGPLEIDMKASDALEELFIPFEVSGDRAVIDSERGKALYRSVNGDTTIEEFEKDPKSAVEDNLGVRLRDPAPIFLGARMGRPEKAERRSLKGDPQLLFPCGKEEGGRMRNLMRSYNEYGEVKEEIIHNFCEKCNREVYFRYCPYCGEEASEKRKCTSCGERTDKESCPSCNSSTSRKGSTDIPVKELLNIAKRNLDMRRFPELLKSPRAVTGKHRHVEPIEKGLLRKKYDLYVNKDGTTRYDSTDLPLTHFKPEEIGTDVEKLRDLGYKKDINGDELKEEDQVLQLKPQDIIVSRNQMNYSGAEYLYKASGFVDELLEKFYGIDSFYDLDSPEEVVGELVIGLAPHTSGGVVGRVIGFTDSKGTYSHPYWHAAKRRNADGD
ncbi:MAG: DNA polymerase II large subunit, partial [Candidatus Nanohaloarchaea archaeon]|nr:DNA polymerase II large subunit [Candidatus Nanohaloarchaea archaeon]